MPIGAYVVHYADGQQREIPIVGGEDIRDWWVMPDEPEIASTPKVGWTGTTPQGVPIQLFITMWKNPRPGVEISSLDYVSKMTQAGPFLVAITVEPEG